MQFQFSYNLNQHNIWILKAVQYVCQTLKEGLINIVTDENKMDPKPWQP